MLVKKNKVPKVVNASMTFFTRKKNLLYVIISNIIYNRKEKNAYYWNRGFWVQILPITEFVELRNRQRDLNPGSFSGISILPQQLFQISPPMEDDKLEDETPQLGESTTLLRGIDKLLRISQLLEIEVREFRDIWAKFTQYIMDYCNKLLI